MSAVNSPTKRTLSSPVSDSPPATASLPSPSAFDIIPALYTLLARLLPTATSSDPPLEPQHLAIEASTVKIKLQKALAAVEALPDMDRTLEQQQSEIRELEEHIRRQQQMLAALAAQARDASGGEQMIID
ncbi:MAG: hypothetical protein M1816_005084 [Peltula sp. TS41687]|nr:MAG: hypothetical protein M1816_005084 [Peltula sp. TS41687]